MPEAERQGMMDTATPEEKRTEEVALETESQLIRGTVTLPVEGYRARFSDYLNRADLDFIALIDAEKEPLGDGTCTRHAFLAVARKAILFAYPAGQSDPSGQ